PDRDALHPVRHRGDLPLPRGRGAAGVRDVRARGDDRVHRAAVRGVRLRLAEGCARVEVTSQRIDGGGDLRIRLMRPRQVSGGELEGADLEQYVQYRLWLT